MVTTIQISRITRQLLRSLKEKSREKYNSYDDVLRDLLKENVKPDSLAAAYPQLKWNKETDRMKFRGE